jgi:UDP-2-acetamido-3-amino-2,3-dideoxy-glucuronate N-acetyltransferase
MTALVHPTASIGADTLLGAWTCIGEAVVIGDRCSIGNSCDIGAGVNVGSGVQIGSGVVILDGQADLVATSVGDGTWIGANATIHAGLRLEAGCFVKPGATVTRSVPAAAIVEGNPASIIGYVNTLAGPLNAIRPAQRLADQLVQATSVGGVKVYQAPIIADLRGNLTVGEFESWIPFAPLRYFMVFDVPSKEIRGEHAHRECHQFLICVRGSCSVMFDDGSRREEITLDSPHRGLHLPPMTWGVQYKYSQDALLLVFASHHYDAADYVRDYEEFKRLLSHV